MATPIITNASQLDFTLADLPDMPRPKGVMLVKPDHFDIQYVINPYMADHIGNVDKAAATAQWNAIRDIYQSLGLEVHEVASQPGLPDMIFCANQSLPFLNGDPATDNRREVIMSIMNADERKDEVAFIEQWYRQNGYLIHHLDPNTIPRFEGMGDAIWHAGKRLLWGGYGFRSSLEAYETIGETVGVPIIALRLEDPNFYHLDTCFCSLTEDTALFFPEAFDQTGLELLQALYPNLLPVNRHEAHELFACNANCPDGQNVVIQKGCVETTAALKNAGFTVHEVDTTEYLKCGGSVFCMKMMVW